MHSCNSITFFIYSGCLYFLSTFWCLKVKLIQKVYGIGRASLLLACAWLDLYSPAICISFNGSNFKGLTAFLHLINSLSSCYVLGCVQWKRSDSDTSLEKSNKKKSLLSSAFLHSSSSPVLNVTKSRGQLHIAALGQQQRPAGEVSSHRRAPRGACISPGEIKLPPLKHWPTLTTRKVFS